jgi:hypothetical protein
MTQTLYAHMNKRKNFKKEKKNLKKEIIRTMNMVLNV